VLKKLGGDAKPSTLMFAKFSPDSRKVAYVMGGNIFVESLHSKQIEQITNSDSGEIINGTFDWVYEEEFGLRDGYRWSPDGKRIAYWQLNTRGVPEFLLVNNTDELYPKTQRFGYPKVGQLNPACRIGIVSVSGGETHWINLPGDPRDNYIARMEWPGNAQKVVLQQLNRRQNTNRVILADADSIDTVLTETDDAWVNVHDEMFWLKDGSRFTWISERDGWRHVYLVSRGGEEISLATPGEFDVIAITGSVPECPDSLGA